MQKIGQCLISFNGNLNFVLLRPYDNANQGHKNVERRVQLKIKVNQYVFYNSLYEADEIPR